jgi:catechol 2,3-dioxygenase-like lactoylglutathione lyase family enzyme
VDDIQRARQFYEEILKQKVTFDFGENIVFEGGFAVHLKSHFSKLIDNKEITKGSNSFELYFEEDEIDLFVKELKKNKVELLHELREQPWRQKVVRFYDPDRNIVEVGESIEHLSSRLSTEGKSIEQISRIINMPEELVTEFINQRSQERSR